MNMLPASLSHVLTQKKSHDEVLHLRRHAIPTITDGIVAQQDGVRYLSFCSNDYLGIATALASFPMRIPAYGAGASRLITGSHPAYVALEKELADMKGTQAAWVFGNGYLACIGVIPALMTKGDVILMDRLSHACMIDGCVLSGARFLRYDHNDMAHLELLLKTHRAKYRHCLLLTETVFSMDGDRAPLQEMAALAERHECWLMSDDAHGFGLPAPIPNPAAIQMGTLSKAAGGYGGYVAGDQLLIDHFITHARTSLFSTALPQAVVDANMHGLHLMHTQPERAERVMHHAVRLCGALGMPAPQSAIIPIIIGENEAVLKVQAALKTRGILVSAIRSPSVPKGTARLRISLSAAHSKAHIEQLISGLQECLTKDIIFMQEARRQSLATRDSD